MMSAASKSVFTTARSNVGRHLSGFINRWPVKCFVFVLVFLCTHSANASTELFSIIIGNNEAPKNSATALETLRYADDDAMRYYEFMRGITGPQNIHLLTYPDSRTQKKFAEIINYAKAPTLAELARAVSDLKEKIQRCKEQDIDTVFYFVFSGHGALNAQTETFLSMQDGELTRRVLYDEILAPLSTDYQHLFIDACYAEGVVGTRGMFDREQNSSSVSVNANERLFLENRTPLEDNKGLGMLIASSAYQESHEWSKYESGVFTHEILSGLAGPADVNNDGKIEYSELAAFVSSANRAVKDPRGQVALIAYAPPRNSRVPIVDYSSLGQQSFFYGDPSHMGHFHIEVEYGIRYLDANLGYQDMTYIAVPSGKTIFFRTANEEAIVVLEAGENMPLANLELKQSEVASRGAIASALRVGLFETRFGAAYYQGYVDNLNQISVNFDANRMVFETEHTKRKFLAGPVAGSTEAPLPEAKKSDEVYGKPNILPDGPAYVDNRSKRKVIYWSLLAFSAAGYSSAIILGALSMKYRQDYQNTALEKKSAQFNTRYRNMGTAFWVASTAATTGLIAALLIRPKRKAQLKVSGSAFPSGAQMQLNLKF
jgi:hypothetical protein